MLQSFCTWWCFSRCLNKSVVLLCGTDTEVMHPLQMISSCSTSLSNKQMTVCFFKASSLPSALDIWFWFCLSTLYCYSSIQKCCYSRAKTSTISISALWVAAQFQFWDWDILLVLLFVWFLAVKYFPAKLKLGQSACHKLIYTVYQNWLVRIDFLFCLLIFVDLDCLMDRTQRTTLWIFAVDHWWRLEAQNMVFGTALLDCLVAGSLFLERNKFFKYAAEFSKSIATILNANIAVSRSFDWKKAKIVIGINIWLIVQPELTLF